MRLKAYERDFVRSEVAFCPGELRRAPVGRRGRGGFRLPPRAARVAGFFGPGGNGPVFPHPLCAGYAPFGAILVDAPLRNAPFLRRLADG